MTSPTRLSLDCRAIDGNFWPHIAGRVVDALEARAAPLRDAVLLLPPGGLLREARAAYAQRGGWQPRIETVDTLAAALAPPGNAEPGTFSGDADTDRLQAGALLRRHPLAAAWASRDPRAFAAATTALLATAQALNEACARRPAAARPAWWAGLRQVLPPVHGPGASERLLARLALEWAASAPVPRTDALLTLQPSAWVVLTAAGQGEAALELLATQTDSPVLQLAADGTAQHPFDDVAALNPPRRRCAGGLEDEAQGAALAVIEALDAGAASVALVAQDRLAVRRIRALLDRAGIAIDDETGWTLSTTRSAARLMVWLRAIAPDGGRDAQIEALRAEGADGTGVDALEAAWRSERAPTGPAGALHDGWRDEPPDLSRRSAPHSLRHAAGTVHQPQHPRSADRGTADCRDARQP
jgi:ATP-dependent helicase/nuclease subunit B